MAALWLLVGVGHGSGRGGANHSDAVATRWLLAAAELGKHHAQLEQLVKQRTQQLETSLGAVAGMPSAWPRWAHWRPAWPDEINNPVGMILLSAEQAMQSLPRMNARQRSRCCWAKSSRTPNAADASSRTSCDFARQEPAERWPDDVNAVVQHAIELTSAYVSRCGGVVEIQLAEALPKVRLNPVELEQVFVNLICNGVEAADGSPRVLVRSEQIGTQVRIMFRDNGRGVAVDDRSRIFDPFYTTRQDEGGTGLGLSLAYGIVTDHGGTIRVDSAADGGTEMIIDLPGHLEESSVVSR